MEDLSRFTQLYPLNKTLRFELKPVGDTLNHIYASGLLDQDRHRDESYAGVKKLIDRYHKAFIERVLSGLELDGEQIVKYDRLYHTAPKDEKEKTAMEKVQDALRKQIHSAFKKAGYENMAKKEFIVEELPRFLREEGGTEEELKLVEEFKGFTTYFGGFHENRANMYSESAQATAVGFRLIHENLPRFVDNVDTFRKLVAVPEIADKLPTLQVVFGRLLHSTSIEEVFTLDYYTHVLTQQQIEAYNAVIGGKTEEDGVKLQGLNEYVNLYNQQHPEGKLPLLKRLYKQILSDRENVSWLPEQFEKDSEVLTAVNGLWKELSSATLPALMDLLQKLCEYDADKIYLPNDTSLTAISQRAYGHWGVIKDALMEQLRLANPRKVTKKGAESDETYEERIEKLYKSRDSFSLKQIDDAVAAFYVSDEGAKPTSVVEYFMRVDTTKDGNNLFTPLNKLDDDTQSLLAAEYPEDKKLVQDKENVALIKALLDRLKDLQHFVKPLLGHGDEPDKDERFYGELMPLWDDLGRLTPLYNKVRNYLTQKPYSQEKIKLNFENSTLADGWDLNKERDNTCVILRREGLFYLAIMNKRCNRVFVDAPRYVTGDKYDKMVYKLLPGANKMLPKVFFSKSRIHEFNPSDSLLAHYEAGTHKKGDTFRLDHCHELIDFFKASIAKHEDWCKFDFRFSPTSAYEDISGFYREVETQGYKVNFVPISKDYIDTLVSEGKLYLFQIYSKDFSPYSHGTPNTHTLYWRMLFDEQNLADVVYQLNGGAEVFFRKRSLTRGIVVHPKGQAIANKNPLNEKPKSTFAYDITKDRRYTVDKFQFHVPITVNFKAQSASLNPMVKEFLARSKDAHIIGIDRGERHLLYLTVINQRGEIVEQRSLNIVDQTDYHDLLDRREKARQRARNDWDHIEGIKELKEGYLSQIVHRVTQLMVKYNAIVVLEDLNFGFMRGRQKVEKQVYQKFEKMLIDKLNYLVDKKADPSALGGLLHAYQLTNKFESFAKMGKQNGFLFYIPAWNTSKIDPVTGFVNLIDTRYVNATKARELFGRMDAIRYNAEQDRFEFDINYDKFTAKAAVSRTRWTLCTYGERIETFRNPEKNNEWDSRTIHLTDELKAHLRRHSISLEDDLRAKILKQDGKDFFAPLLRLLRLTLQMRNSRSGSAAAEDDYIISPVCDADGHFFDSRNDYHGRLPKDADANGAYNIARKGLMAIRQLQDAVKAGRDINEKKFKLDLSNKEWLRFAQEKPYLDE